MVSAAQNWDRNNGANNKAEDLQQAYLQVYHADIVACKQPIARSTAATAHLSYKSLCSKSSLA